jgi:hypothetical protein
MSPPRPLQFDGPTHVIVRGRRLCSMLQRCGIFPSWITYLNGPEHGLFRFALSSEHTTDDIQRLTNVIGNWIR